jgi:hypothetical protein
MKIARTGEAAAQARIDARVLELLNEFPDEPVHRLIAVARFEEFWLYGRPDAIAVPRGILNLESS